MNVREVCMCVGVCGKRDTVTVKGFHIFSTLCCMCSLATIPPAKMTFFNIRKFTTIILKWQLLVTSHPLIS